MPFGTKKLCKPPVNGVPLMLITVKVALSISVSLLLGSITTSALIGVL